MSDPEKKNKALTTAVVTDASLERRSHNGTLDSLRHADDALLAELGYKSEFKREFSVSNLRVIVFSNGSHSP